MPQMSVDRGQLLQTEAANTRIKPENRISEPRRHSACLYGAEIDKTEQEK